jgi:histidinol-phosphate aminotransferase
VSASTADREAALEIARAAYRDIPLYTVNQSPVAVDLSDNTNLWGVPPAAARAIVDAAAAVTRYPAVYASGLKALLAAYIGVPSETLVTGCGSDDVIDSAIRAVAEPGDSIAHPEPTFHMAVTFGRMNGLVPVAVPLTDTWDADPEAFIATGARVIYLCTPNNPTGTAMSRTAIEYVVEHAPGLVIIDEAYAEYAGTTAIDLAARSDRLLVTRTMSKAFGLAGLRIGYATGAPALVREVEKSRGPYKVNVVAERAARAALTEDRQWVRSHVDEAIANRGRLAAELTAMGLPPLPSAANFVLVPTPRATALARRLREFGVGVRPYAGILGIGDALRVTVGPWTLMQTFLDALRSALAEPG